MHKQEFLNQLGQLLQQLPQEEKEKQLAYYSELIDDMTEDGIAEEEAVAKLGTPEEIAETILREQPAPPPKAPTQAPARLGTGWTVLTIILAILSSPIWLPILIAILAILLSISITLWAILISFFVTILALGISGIAMLILPFWQISFSGPLCLMAIGSGLMLIGLGILGFFAVFFLTKGLIFLTKWLFKITKKGIKSLFCRKERNHE